MFLPAIWRGIECDLGQLLLNAFGRGGQGLGGLGGGLVVLLGSLAGRG